MRPQVTLLGLLEFTALIAITLAIDTGLWRWASDRGHATFGSATVVRELFASTIAGWGTILGVYLAWRLTRIQEKWLFIVLSVMIGGVATFAHVFLWFNILDFHMDNMDWQLFPLVGLLLAVWSSIASLLLSGGIAIVIALKDWVQNSGVENGE